MENQIKKDLQNLKKTIDELLDDRKTVFNAIAELYDYIDENRYTNIVETNYVLEQLANIQQYAK